MHLRDNCPANIIKWKNSIQWWWELQEDRKRRQPWRLSWIGYEHGGRLVETEKRRQGIRAQDWRCETQKIINEKEDGRYWSRVDLLDRAAQGRQNETEEEVNERRLSLRERVAERIQNEMQDESNARRENIWSWME